MNMTMECHVKESLIRGAGHGLFLGNVRCKRGRRIQLVDYRAATNKEAREDHKFIAWIDDEPLFVLSEARYANHSKDPNAELVTWNDGTMELKALRDIQPGVEITIDYGVDWS